MGGAVGPKVRDRNKFYTKDGLKMFLFYKSS
jgi:hypothetical protein